jgi:Tfp pilus assembly protein PilF
MAMDSAVADDGDWLDTLGWVLYKRGEFDEAVKMLRRAVAIPAKPRFLKNDQIIDTHLQQAVAAAEGGVGTGKGER